MKEIRIPLTDFKEDQTAEVTVNIAGKIQKYEYRVESFPWSKAENQSKDDIVAQSLTKIYSLKEHIDGYNKDWELLQIYTPLEDAKYVQVLFRRKK